MVPEVTAAEAASWRSRRNPASRSPHSVPLPRPRRRVQGAMVAKSPGPYAISSPSSMRTTMRPETKYPVCAAWQLSVWAMGLPCLDHCQPGWKVARPTGPPYRLTSSTIPMPSSKGRVSSGVSRLFHTNPAILIPFRRFSHTMTACPGDRPGLRTNGQAAISLSLNRAVDFRIHLLMDAPGRGSS
jgi:hypothetical protein